MTEQMSLDESMTQCTTYFESAVLSASKTPQEIYEEFGEHLGVSWELRQELLSGEPLLSWNMLPREVREEVKEIISLVEALPESAFRGSGLQDLFDPSWDVVRKAALEFLESKSRRTGRVV